MLSNNYSMSPLFDHSYYVLVETAHNINGLCFILSPLSFLVYASKSASIMS